VIAIVILGLASCLLTTKKNGRDSHMPQHPIFDVSPENEGAGLLLFGQGQKIQH
jgi:hypothetical protein